MKKIIVTVFIAGILSCMPAVVFADGDYLQAGVFKDSVNAVKFVNRVRALTRQPSGVITQVETKKKRRFWVIIEGFDNKAQAQATQKTLAKQGLMTVVKRHTKAQQKLYRWAEAPILEEARVLSANERLIKAIQNPEILFSHEIRMPAAPNVKTRKVFKMSLREAILLLLRYNPSIQNAELDRITQRFALRIAENEFEWQYALSGSANYTKTKSRGITGPIANSLLLNAEASRKTAIGTEFTVSMANNYDGDFYNPTLDFEITQPLLRGLGSTVNQIDLKNAIDQEESNILSLKNQIIVDITSLISSYRSIITQNNSLANQRQTLKDAKKTYQDNIKKIAAGTLEPTGNIQQGVQVQSLQLDLISQENSLINAKRSLLQSIGLDPNMNIELPNDVEVKDLSIPPLKETIDYALANNIDYQNQLIAYRATQRELIRAKNDQLWQLDLSANTTLGSATGRGIDANLASLFNGRNILNSIDLTFSVPINDLQNQSSLINAKVALEQARINLIAARRQLVIDVRNNLTDLKSLVEQYQLSERQLDLSQKSYNLEKKKVDAGIASTLDLSNTQNSLLGAQNTLIQSKVDILNKRSDLEQLLGTTLDVWKIKLRYS